MSDTPSPNAELPQLIGRDDILEVDIGWIMRKRWDDLSQVPKNEHGLDYVSGVAAASFLYDELKPRLERSPAGRIVLFRLDTVILTCDFAEEIVRMLVCKDQPECLTRDKIVCLVNPDPSTLMTLHRALDAAKHACVVLDTGGGAQSSDWQLWYIGTLQPYLLEIIAFVRDRGSVSSKDVSGRFDIRMADASRRLKELFGNGMLRRQPITNEEGKLAYLYSYFHPSLEKDEEVPRNALRYARYATAAGR